MKIELTRSLKIRLLKALQDGFMETDNFPELDSTPKTGSIPIADWIKYRIKENAKSEASL
jgi:hypothetical protein